MKLLYSSTLLLSSLLPSHSFSAFTTLERPFYGINKESYQSTRALLTTSRSGSTSITPLYSSEVDDYAPSDIDDHVGGVTDTTTTTSVGDASDINKDEVIQSILRIASASDRGQNASPSDKETIDSSIQSLEKLNPDSSTALNPSMYGTWDLLYSSTQLFRSSPFFMAGRAVCKTEEEASRYNWFCDMHRAALAISNIGKVRQIISSEGRLTSEFEVKVGAVPFLSDFTPFAYSGGWPVTIDGAIVSTADVTPTSDGSGWEIFMDQVEIKGSNVPLLRQLLDQESVSLQSRELGSFLEQNVESYENPKPIFQTTYLDDNLRISRDEDNNMFVYAKVSGVSDPTDYSSVDSDLGITKLLGGLNDNFFKVYI